MIIRRKFVVIDTKGTVPSPGEIPFAIDRVRIQYDLDIQDASNRDLVEWSVACTTGDIFKDGLGLVYICAVMWAEDNEKK